ncbi:MAG: hypothetical protein QM754_21335 [Tepidisphaeraceae bacterium]
MPATKSPAASSSAAKARSAVCGRMGNQWVYTGDYRSLDQDMATLLAVTPASLKQLLDEYTFDPMTIVTLGPG